MNPELMEAYAGLDPEVLKAIEPEVKTLMECFDRIREKAGNNIVSFAHIKEDGSISEPTEEELGVDMDAIKDTQTSFIAIYVSGFLALQCEHAGKVPGLLEHMFMEGVNNGNVFRMGKEVTRN